MLSLIYTGKVPDESRPATTPVAGSQRGTGLGLGARDTTDSIDLSIQSHMPRATCHGSDRHAM